MLWQTCRNLRVATVVAVPIVVLVVSSSARGGPVIRYVDDDAPAGGDGTTWTTAYRSLQDALAFAADPAHGIIEVRVGQGTYQPDRSAANPPGSGDRTATFQLISDVALRGGFAGFGAPDPDERDVELYVTILSGDLLGNDEPGFTNYGDNSYHVLNGSGVDETAVVDGFAVTGGNADGAVDEFFGGGIFNDGGRPVLNACTFSANFGGQGGGMYNRDGSPSLIGCVFTSNATLLKGGGLNSDGGCAELINCTFSFNSAQFGGGGVYNEGGVEQIINCTISGNSGTAAGGLWNHHSSPTIVNTTFAGNLAALGGGIRNTGHSSPAVINCAFIGNIADHSGGGMHNQAGFHELVRPLIVGCTFTNNAALGTLDCGVFCGRGGAIFNLSSTPTVRDCVFTANTASFAGGAIYIHEKSPTVLNCTFTNNLAQEYGGAIFTSYASPTVINCVFSGNVAQDKGGAITTSSASATVTSCTFSGNLANKGGGAMHNGYSSTTTVANCILRDNMPDQIFDDVSLSSTVRYSNVQGAWPGAGSNNIDVDPLFVDPDGPDDIPGTEDDDLRLQPGSPCIDAGNNWALPPDTTDVDDDGDTLELVPLDVDGNPRFAADDIEFDEGCGVPVVVDMGAYEHPGTPAECVRPGDVDGNGTVNVLDLIAVLLVFGPCQPECCLADFDLDGAVDPVDLLQVLGAFGTTCP